MLNEVLLCYHIWLKSRRSEVIKALYAEEEDRIKKEKKS